MHVKRLTAVSVGHFAIDILNSSLAMILTAASGLFDISVSQIGLAAMIYTFAASLTQPLFGVLADWLRGRWLAAAGLLWTMVFFGIAPFMPTFWSMVACLTIAALGSGAFHPVGMINATASGGRYPTTATSIFFVLGQTGLALGPFIAGILLQTVGFSGLPYMALAMTPAVIFMLIYTHSPMPDDTATGVSSASTETNAASDTGERSAEPATANASPNPSSPPARQDSNGLRNRGLFVAAAFIALITLRSTTLQSFVILLPKYFDDAGLTPAIYGTMIGVFSLAGASGTFIGGFLGDRYNRRMVIFFAMLLSIPFALAMLNASSWLFFAAAIGAGALLNIPHSILLIMAQRLLPKRKGMIGGAVLGLMFASGAATAAVASWFADWAGLYTVLTFVAFVPLGAGLCALLLPSTRGVAVQPAPAVPRPAAGD